jgi:hypothetical protein
LLELPFWRVIANWDFVINRAEFCPCIFTACAIKWNSKNTGMKSTTVKLELLARAERLRRFNAWEARHPMELDGAAAIAAVGALYELIPADFRKRPFDPQGLCTIRQALSHLKGSS